MLKNLAKDTFVYGIGGLLMKLIGFMFFPIYAHILLYKNLESWN